MKSSSPAARRLPRLLPILAALTAATTPVRSADTPPASPLPAVTIQVDGPWQIRVRADRPMAIDTVLGVTPPPVIGATDERHERLPVFNPNAGGWVKGVQLVGLRAQETTTPFLLDPESLVLRSGPGPNAPFLKRGVDYEADLSWGTIGRLAGGGIGTNQPVFAHYRYSPLRLDSIVMDARGSLAYRIGMPQSAAPALPELQAGDRRLANVWLPGRVQRLEAKHLFPILEDAYPEPPRPTPSVAEVRLPKTMEKLRRGGPLRILAWGDSVTDGGYVPEPEKNRWQKQFLARLQAAFPSARIELVTEAWGGRNTQSYLNEPPGSPHNYREKVLAAKPDLVVSEFVNDAGLNPAGVEQRYARLLADFHEIGAEWVILTPHYVRPDWMGLDRERDIDDDPRPYVAGLRAFVAKPERATGLALADAALRYGRLWRQGIPYTALMLNSINHPDARGMAIFADALMELFPTPTK